MARKVKKGSYWRHTSNKTKVYRAQEDGWSNEPLSMAAIDLNDTSCWVVQQTTIDLHFLHRCKKDGSWFGDGTQTEAQRINRKWLSLMWQAKGALASLQRTCNQGATRTAIVSANDIRLLGEEILASFEAKRRNEVELAQERARAYKRTKLWAED